MSDRDDRIITLRHDIDRLEHELHLRERADLDHRVMDRELWQRTLADRRQELATMKAKLHELLEEDAA